MTPLSICFIYIYIYKILGNIYSKSAGMTLTLHYINSLMLFSSLIPVLYINIYKQNRKDNYTHIAVKFLKENYEFLESQLIIHLVEYGASMTTAYIYATLLRRYGYYERNRRNQRDWICRSKIYEGGDDA